MSDGDTDQYNWSADDDRPLRELRETASPETRASEGTHRGISEPFLATSGGRPSSVHSLCRSQ